MVAPRKVLDRAERRRRGGARTARDRDAPALCHPRSSPEDQKRLLDCLTAGTDWFWEAGPDFRLRWVSDSFFELTGHRPDQVIGKTREELGFRSVAPDPEEVAEAVRRGQPLRELIAHAVLPNGREIWTRASAMPIVDASGVCTGYRGATTEITELVRARREIEESEQRFRDFANAASDWFWETDAEFRVTHISESFYAASGFTPAEVIGLERNQLGFEAVDPAVERVIRAAVAAREPYRDALSTGVMPNGRRLWIRASAVPMFDEAGAFMGYRGSSTNLTAQYQANHALHDSEQRFRDFADAAGDWFWEMGPDLRFTFMSDRVEEFTGWPASHFIGKQRAMLRTATGDEELWRKHLDDLKAHRPYRDFQFRHRRADGSLQWVKTSGKPIFDADGTFLGYRGTGSDITQQKEAELRLQEFAALVQYSDDAIISATPDLIVTSWNPAAERLYGYAAEEVIGRHIGFLAKTAAERRQQDHYHARVLSGQSTDRIEIRRRRKDGTHIVLSLSISPIFDDRGEVAGLCGIARDTTARKQMENSLRDSAERIGAVLSTVTEGIMTFDERGVIESANPAAEQLFAYPPDSLRRCNVSVLLPERQARYDDAVIERYLRSTVSGILAMPHEIEMRRADGSLFPAEMVVTEFSSGGRRMFTGVIRDISERKQAEAKIAAQRDQLEELNHQKDQLFSIIAHDLRSPFNVILGFSELLERSAGGFDADTVARYSAMVHNAGNTAYRLLENLLDWSRLQMGQSDFEPCELDVAAVLARNTELLLPLAEAKGVTLTWKAPGDLLVRADSKMLDTVLRNLIGNAVKYTSEGGRIDVSGCRQR